MFNFLKKKKHQENASSALSWDPQALGALDQSVAQAPVPKMMKSLVKSQLKKAAEEITRTAGRTAVTPQDLMQGMLAKMPANMRGRVEDAMKKGPEGLKSLEQELKKKK